MTLDAARYHTTVSLLSHKDYRPTFGVQPGLGRPVAVLRVAEGLSVTSQAPKHLRALALAALLAADALDDALDAAALAQ